MAVNAKSAEWIKKDKEFLKRARMSAAEHILLLNFDEPVNS